MYYCLYYYRLLNLFNLLNFYHFLLNYQNQIDFRVIFCDKLAHLNLCLVFFWRNFVMDSQNFNHGFNHFTFLIIIM